MNKFVNVIVACAVAGLFMWAATDPWFYKDPVHMFVIIILIFLLVIIGVTSARL